MARSVAQVDARLTTEIQNRAAEDTKLRALIDDALRRIAILEGEPEPPPPPPPPPPASTGAIGTIAIDSKANLRLGPDGKVSARFRSRGGIPKSIRWSQRGGSGYSGGAGCMVGQSIYTDSAGKPGVRVAYIAKAFANSVTFTTYEDVPFVGAVPTLTAGELYHFVLENLDGNPGTNYISVNFLYAWNQPNPQNPAQPDLECLTNRGSGWNVEADGGYVPVFDLTYEDGGHDGQGYIEAFVQFAGGIGGSEVVRQTFTPPAGTYSELGVRVRRTAGTAALIVRFAGGDHTILSSQVPLIKPSDPADIETKKGAVWVKMAGPWNLDGSAEQILLLTNSGTRYETTPIREGTVEGFRSARVTSGKVEYSSDGGQTWRPPYQYAESEAQFYLR